MSESASTDESPEVSAEDRGAASPQEAAPGPGSKIPRRPAARFTARDVGSFFVTLIGLGMAGSALLLNPITGRVIWREHVVDKIDVLTGYAVASLLLGGFVMFLGSRIGRDVSGKRDGWAMLGIVLAFVLLADRLLLVQFGLPLWIHDAELHYRHRPDAVRTLARAGRARELIRINSHGHHDSEVELVKPDGQFRGLLIGDSITMGDQVTYDETFAAQLEASLGARGGAAGAHESYEMVNTGVHGYASYQEAQMLRESLRFDPDFVAIGFCMNDLTEPSVVARGFDDVEGDYHHVAASSSALQGFLLNETGFGRLVQNFAGSSKTAAGERRAELELVQRVASADRDDAEWGEAWRWVLFDLEEMYRMSAEANVPAVLLIFPFTFQLLDDDARRPQEILTEHARQHGVSVIDLTEDFADRVYQDGDLLGLLRARGYSNERIERVFHDDLRRYFLDNDHLTRAGHEIVANRMLEYLLESGLLHEKNGARS